VVTQIAVSLLLLITSGLFIRNLRNTQHAQPGFELDNALMMSFDSRSGELQRRARQGF
jgi:hypothetical protein